MTEKFDSRQATQYLLGLLPPVEAARVDELSVTDDNFATGLSVAENDLVDAYIQGELSSAELKQFDSHYLASPLRREKVQFAQAFQSWAEQHSVSQLPAEADTLPKRTKSRWFSALSIAAPRPALQWGFAFVALVFLIVGAWLAVENSRLRRQMLQAQASGANQISQREQDLKNKLNEQRAANSQSEQELAQLRTERERLEQELQQRGQQRPAVSAIASFILTPQLRGAGQIKTITIPNGTERVAMHLKLEPNEYSRYSVVLVEQGTNRTVWRSGKSQARGTADSKTLTVNFAARLLTAQNYLLRVSGIASQGGSEVLSDYPFRVMK